MTAITLRYFDCRGRAEALRRLLRDYRVEFLDHREPILDIAKVSSELKGDIERGGPFGYLPVLRWGEATVFQTLAIASFIARKLRLYEGLDDEAIARQEGFTSAAYLELTHPLPQLVYSPVLWAEVPFARVLHITTRGVIDYPRRFETLLTDEWLGGSRPLPSDFFLWEGLSGWLTALGEPYQDLLRGLPRLSAWFDRMTHRIADPALNQQPFTASPQESATFEQARQFVRARGLPWSRT